MTHEQRNELLTYLALAPAVLVAIQGCPFEKDRRSPPDASSTTTLTGTATRTADGPGPGNDGRGVLYVIALEACDLGAPLVAATAVPGTDFSGSSDVPFTLEGVDADRVYIAAFLDDDDNADPQAPRPDPGDLVHADVTGDGTLSCVSASASTDAGSVEVPLNTVVPGP